MEIFLLAANLSEKQLNSHNQPVTLYLKHLYLPHYSAGKKPYIYNQTIL